MRIVYLVNDINGTTGLERMVSVQCNYFVRQFNYDIHIVLTQQKKTAERNTFFEIDSSIPLHFMEARRGTNKNYFKLVRAIKHKLVELSPDIVMVCIDDIAWLYVPYFLKGNYKIVYQRHSTKDINLNRYYKGIKTKISNILKSKLIGFGGRCYDTFVILTEEHKNDWKYVKHLRVIGNPIVFEADGRQSDLNNKVVIAVGRHDPVKGYDMLLKSWAMVIKDFPDWRLRIVGKKTTKVDLKAEAEALNVTSYVEFINFTKDIASEYLQASVLVCSSVLEGFALTIVEAMALGIPAVSFDCPYGPRDIIKHEEDGLLVPPKNIEALSEALKYLIKEESVRKEMGKKAIVNIQRFSMDNIMMLWKNLFDELVPPK